MATRKCSICKKDIDIDGDNKDYFVEHKKSGTVCSHIDCYIKYHTLKKRNPKTVEECNNYISECQKNVQCQVKNKNIRNQLYDFLFQMYGISYFPNYFYIKMNSVFKGTYKNLNRPVSPEDLLDMWVQKENYLNKVAEQNRKKGNEITGVNRVYYDLAILLGKYDDYLSWKHNQELAVAEINEMKKRDVERVEYTDIVRPNKNTVKHNSKEIDIASILNDI